MTDLNTGDPIANMQLLVFAPGSTDPIVIYTDDNGNYSTDSLDSGDGYVITASGGGYSFLYVAGINLDGSGVQVNISMVLTGSMTGTITDTDGNPIAGASVTFYAQEFPWAGFSTAITDDSGNYSLDGIDVAPELDATLFNILVVQDNFSYLTDSCLIGPNYQPNDVGTYDATLSNLGSISGIVLDQYGAPINNGFVSVQESSGLGLSTGTTITNLDGTFAVNGLQDGASLSVAIEAGGAISNQFNTETGNYLEVTMEMTASIIGAVVDSDGNPLPGVLVSVLTADNLLTSGTITIDDGSFEVVSFYFGDYTVLMSLAGFDSPPEIPITIDDNIQYSIGTIMFSSPVDSA